MNTVTASGYRSRTVRMPSTSISSSDHPPASRARSTSLQSVPYRNPLRWTSAHSRNSPASRRRSKSGRVRK